MSQDIKIVNADSFNPGKEPLLCKYKLSYKTPIIPDPSNWRVSVMRVQIPVKLIPIMEITSSSNFKLTLVKDSDPTERKTYDIGELYGIGKQVTSYASFLRVINDCISTWLTGYVDLAGQGLSFRYNTNTKRLEAYFQEQYDPTKPEYHVFMNTELMWLFAGFEHERNGADLASDTAYYMSIINPYNYDKVADPEYEEGKHDNKYYYKVDSEFSSMGNWHDIQRIILTSTIPTVKEVTTQNVTDTYGLMSQGSLEILTDFAVIPEDVGRSDMVYLPSGEFRYSDMDNAQPLQEFEINLMYQKKDGTIHPIYFPHKSHFSVKLMFVRKGSIHPDTNKVE